MIRNKAHIVARSMHKKEPSAGAQLGIDPYFNFAVNNSTFCLGMLCCLYSIKLRAT